MPQNAVFASLKWPNFNQQGANSKKEIYIVEVCMPWTYTDDHTINLNRI